MQCTESSELSTQHLLHMSPINVGHSTLHRKLVEITSILTLFKGLIVFNHDSSCKSTLVEYLPTYLYPELRFEHVPCPCEGLISLAWYSPNLAERSGSQMY